MSTNNADCDANMAWRYECPKCHSTLRFSLNGQPPQGDLVCWQCKRWFLADEGTPEHIDGADDNG